MMPRPSALLIMEIKDAFDALTAIRDGNLRSRLTEGQIEYEVGKVFGALGFPHADKQYLDVSRDKMIKHLARNSHFKAPARVHRKSIGHKSIPDVLLRVDKSCIIPLDVKVPGELEGENRKKNLQDKARYVRHVNLELDPNGGGVGYGLLTDGETWIIFEVQSVENRAATFDRVRVLLQFEASTEATKTLLKDASKRVGPRAAKRASLELALEMTESQVTLTKAILPRLAPTKITRFLTFLSEAHGRMDWRQFDRLMNLSLDERLAYFKASYHASGEDVAVARAIYSSAQFAVEIVKPIIASKSLQLPKDLPTPAAQQRGKK